MQKAWSIANASRELFIFETIGGDAELAAKDISVWRGNSDLPVANFDLPTSREEAILKLRGILSELDQSNTVCIRLTEASRIAQARDLTEAATREIDGADKMLLIFVLEASDAATYLAEAGDQGLLLPSLSERPSDVASYARRFARIASERSEKRNCSEFTPEAVYLILSYDWPGGYKEVQEVVTRAVKSSETDAAITVERLQEALGLETADIASPDSRLLSLMKIAQRSYFEKEMLASGISAADLARKLEFDSSIQTKDDLKNMPLVKSELAKL
jgi:hypothetical protein